MKVLLWALRRRVPLFIKKWALGRLFAATAGAFGCPAPRLAGQSYPARLQAYACFTAAQAEKALKNAEELPALQERLYQEARRLGKKVRRLLGLRTRKEALAAARILYSVLSIDLEGSGDTITVYRCFFSRYYSAPVCRLIGALDAGVLAGLTGGQGLAFDRRITEGYPRCEGRLQ